MFSNIAYQTLFKQSISVLQRIIPVLRGSLHINFTSIMSHNKQTNRHLLTLLKLIIIFAFEGGETIRILKLDIPDAARAGTSVKLVCTYDLQVN